MDMDDILRDRFMDTRLCFKCVEEPDLEQFIEGTEGEPGCSFCECDDAPTCGFVDFMEHVSECVWAEYDLAANCLSWESRQGGWQWGPVWSTYELVTDELEIGLPRVNGDKLLRAMVDYLGHDDWCVRNPYGEDPVETLRYGWQQFRYLTQYRTRFFLDRWASPLSGISLALRDQPTPAEMLSAVGEGIQRMELYRELSADSCVYRARYCKNNRLLNTPEELGPPPPERAVVANRMSPPGIVMFYAALDSETALAETVAGAGTFSVGKFAVRRSLWLLDLTSVPAVPGFFESIPDSQPWGRHDAQFFRQLVEDLTRPIERDNRVHIEYIPTQVVTEYFRMTFHDEHGTPTLDGIVYPSARSSSLPAVVLFADRSAVMGIEQDGTDNSNAPWLELVGVEHYRATSQIQIGPLESPLQ